MLRGNGEQREAAAAEQQSIITSPQSEALQLLDRPGNYKRAAVKSDNMREDTNYGEVRRRHCR